MNFTHISFNNKTAWHCATRALPKTMSGLKRYAHSPWIEAAHEFLSMNSFVSSVRRRFLPLLWRNSLWAYRQYRHHPRSIWLRRTFDELIVREDVWSGETKLRGLSSLRDFDTAARDVDLDNAEKIAKTIIEGLRDPLERGAARLILAARALLSHDSLILADRLLLENRPQENLLNAQMERVFLTLGYEGAGVSNRQLVLALARDGAAPIGSLLKAWIRSRWLYEGPSQQLVRDVLQLVDKARRQQLFVLKEGLALAFLMNDMSMVKTLLNSSPELYKSYDSVLPLARYLYAGGVPSALSSDRARVLEYAELLDQLEAGTSALVGTLNDSSRSLAIVGNSPCELGLGRGPLIDSHYMVARFNLFSTSDAFVSDYGRKSSIHVRHPEGEDTNQCSLVSDLIVMNRPDLVYRQRNWENVVALASSGAKLAALPTGFHQQLYKKLGGEPSGGIIFCALVKAIRGLLPRASCFGFSFVDQLGKEATSAHYFRQARPSFKHRWTREKNLFEELTAVMPTPGSAH